MEKLKKSSPILLKSDKAFRSSDYLKEAYQNCLVEKSFFTHSCIKKINNSFTKRETDPSSTWADLRSQRDDLRSLWGYPGANGVTVEPRE